TDVDTVALTVTAQNDAPTLAANTGSTVAIGGTDAIATTELQVSDADNASAQLTYTVTVGPVNGQLELTTASGFAITSFTQAQIDAGQVVYVHNGSLTATDSFTFTVTDGAGGNIGATTFGITVTGMNGVPTLGVNAGSTVVQGLPDVITAGELQVVDLDNTPSQLTYTITAAPANGQLELTTAPGVAITTFTQADIDAGRVVFVHNGAAATSDSFTFTVNDGAGGTIGATTFAFTVSPFFPPLGGSGGSGGGTGGTGGTGSGSGTGSGTGSGSGSGTGAGSVTGGVFVPPAIQPPPVPISMALPVSETSVAGATGDPLPRALSTNRTFARIEQPTVGMQEPSMLHSEPFSLPVKKVLAVGHKLVERLNQLAEDLERDVQERQYHNQLVGHVVSFSGIALSAGFVAWLLRGGTLVASFLVSMPAWRHFDPLPVLSIPVGGRRKRDREMRKELEQENKQFRGVGRVLESPDQNSHNKKHTE
ncbi:MAG: cadherin-like domain-containing protein, partial [Nitrospira sp.]